MNFHINKKLQKLIMNSKRREKVGKDLNALVAFVYSFSFILFILDFNVTSVELAFISLAILQANCIQIV